jgi:GNAT superfamily N-acetyltransferase
MRQWGSHLRLDTVDLAPFAGRIERVFSNPNLLPDAYFVAVDGERYVGLSALWTSQVRKDELMTGLTGLTGTLREYRRRGIAVALKLKGIAWARDHGYQWIKTWNATTNAGVLAINQQLGFVKQPAWIEYAKDLARDGQN